MDCPPGCSSCLSESYCLTCTTGYRMDEVAHFCVKCIQNCIQCAQDSTCEVCRPSYKFDSLTGTCRLALDARNSHSEQHTNLESNELPHPHATSQIVLTLDPESKPFVVESAIPAVSTSFRISNCKIHDINDTCFFCEPGYYIAQNTCQPCSDGCLSCTDSFTCRRCKSGYKATLVNSQIACHLAKVGKSNS